LIVRPQLELAQASALTLAVGLALSDVIAPLVPSPTRVKWPNDLLVSDQKLAGVLVESQLQGDALKAVVIGVGLNVSSREFAPEIAASATSLALLGATDIAREPLLFRLLDALSTRLAEFERTGVRGIVSELNARDALRDTRVRIESVTGIARGIDSNGHLLVEDEHGTVHSILSGTVERL